ncbi:hypothetical protein [Chryseosolibacter indicus]|uniref:Uncharacterized protein n=1 Tax=Chryseosolibacter indicus TaxID=2782351 RepID=A0ABS5VN74_9BACT|nr:hypothetical protein [Chryseosolibacter indicus]MBT1702883.1 hypothetical protein [Chryseosolibacter indicus]
METNRSQSIRLTDARRTVERTDATRMPEGNGGAENSADEIATGSPVTSGEIISSGPDAPTAGSINNETPEASSASRISDDERRGIKESINRDVENDTGRSTGAILGNSEDVMSIPDNFDRED